MATTTKTPTTTKKAASKKAATKTGKKGAKPEAADKAATPPAEEKAPATAPKAGEAARANDGAKGGKTAKAPAPKVEVLTEAEAKVRGGMTEIIKTLKGRDPAMRLAKAPKAKKVSALDAAAQVLAKAKQPMRAKELIEQMAAEGLWTSPGGKTPEATLYAAMLREIGRKGENSRFRKVDRGAFVAAGKGA